MKYRIELQLNELCLQFNNFTVGLFKVVKVILHSPLLCGQASYSQIRDQLPNSCEGDNYRMPFLILRPLRSL